MNIIKRCILLVCISAHSTPPPDYFGDKYEEALTFIRKHERKLQQTISHYDADPELVLSIVFPELIRYNMYKDLFETKANELTYIKRGHPGSYFSIGKFQLKPLFAEKVEATVTSDSVLNKSFSFLAEYKDSVEKNIRFERLNRLKSYTWQLKYICAFTHIVQSRFPGIDSLPKKERIRFYATAFNHDFLCNKEEILRWQQIVSFPYGVKEKSRYAYAEIAAYFYANDLQRILK